MRIMWEGNGLISSAYPKNSKKWALLYIGCNKIVEKWIERVKYSFIEEKSELFNPHDPE